MPTAGGNRQFPYRRPGAPGLVPSARMTKLYHSPGRLLRMRMNLICGLALLAACGSPNKKPPPTRTSMDKRRIEEAIQRHRVLYAMTQSEVVRSIGQPIRKKSETYYGRPRQRWDYFIFLYSRSFY